MNHEDFESTCPMKDMLGDKCVTVNSSEAEE